MTTLPASSSENIVKAPLAPCSRYSLHPSFIAMTTHSDCTAAHTSYADGLIKANVYIHRRLAITQSLSEIATSSQRL